MRARDPIRRVEGVLGDLPVPATVINMQDDPQRAAFDAYRVAFRANEAEPNLRNAAAVVHAWNHFAEVMGMGLEKV